MKIKVDKEAGRVIMDLCNLVARATGINQLTQINSILDNLKIEEEVEDNGEEHS